MSHYHTRRYLFRVLILLALTTSLAIAAPTQRRSRQKQSTKPAQAPPAPVVPPELAKELDDQGSELKEIKGKLDTVQRSLSDLNAELKQQETMHFIEKLLEVLVVGGGGAWLGGFLYRRATTAH